MRQALIHVEGHVRRDEDLAHRGAHHIGQVLAAELLGQVQPVPAAVLDLLEGVLEAGRRVDHAVFQPAALGVADRVQGGQNALGQLAGLFEDGGGEVAVELGIAGDPGFGGLEHVMQQELHVLHGGFVTGHRVSP